MKRSVIAGVALLLVCMARDGTAQGFVSPFIGTTLTSPSTSSTRSKAGFGIAFGRVGRIFGGETEIAFYPELLSKAATGEAKNKVVTFSGNTLIGPTIGPVKLYAGFGAGSLTLSVAKLSNLAVPSLDTISNNYFAFNTGGGVMVFLSEHLGVRGDLRYYRAFGFDIADIQASRLKVNNLNFWRAGIGLAAKF